ncbi:SET [Seminavis robusta]|uniref:SET n=1 Tax=Seminavis robusta TaxID=568900 RepID=A0A9N8E836_9STRA|nr:SET [Seminavis robusta]|eukprot:Sro772_g200340.1 SET (412) ;mRNA; r:40920-42155
MTVNDDDFGCFGSDSEESEVSSQESVNPPTGSSSSDDEQRRRLLEDAHMRQMATDAAAAAHRNRRPVISPDFEVFDTSTAANSNNDCNRGMGLRSLRKYSCGDEILREHAVMRVPNQQAAVSLEEAKAMHSVAVHQSFDRLSAETKQFVLELANSYPSTTTTQAVEQPGQQEIVGVYQTNSFRLGEEESNNCGGLFLTICRINHSCRPNANHSWRADLQAKTVYATQDIDVGEEICITYGTSGECLDTAGRRAYLSERFSFECGCHMCTESDPQGNNDGDRRMNELNSRQQEIPLLLATAAAASSDTDEAGGGETAERVLESVERCLLLLREQGFGTTAGGEYVKPILHYGYQACLLLRRDSRGRLLEESERRARSYLNQELLATKNGEGIESPNVLKLQDLINSIPVTVR